MCGRYVIISTPEAIRNLFGYPDQPNFPPRYNVAPTQPIPVVLWEEGARRFRLMRWGLLPSWVKDPQAFSLLINARGESAAEKPAFRNAMKRRRCLIPADGFYEWKPDGARKRPHFVRMRDGAPFAFAGLWETWTGPNGEEMDTVAIVTTTASPDIGHIHERMPVMLEPDAFHIWLDCAQVDATTAQAVLVPTRPGKLEAIEVSTAVNRVANDSAALIAPSSRDPLEPPEPAPAKRAAKTKPADKRQGSLF